MKKITDLIKNWIECSFDLYNKEYAKLDEGWHDFIPIEEKLFISYVSDKLPNRLKYSNMKEYFDHMVAEYKINIDANRCYERIKNNTTIIESKGFKINKGDLFNINYIDTYGVMTNGIPYISVHYSEKESIFEDLRNLEIFIR